MNFRLIGRFIRKKELGLKLILLEKYKGDIMSQEIFYSKSKIHKPTRVIPLEDYILYIEYEDGKVVHFDVKELFKHPLFKPLEDKLLFQKVKINGSSICWDDDIDICADSIYNS